MRALLSEKVGGPDTLVLTDVADPEAGPGQVVVAVKACAINYPDVIIIEDKYQVKPARPFAPGGEISGVIERVGDGVQGWSIGDRVMATVGHGGLAERVVVDSVRLFRLPTDRSFTQGASLILTYATTMHALVDRGNIRPGDHLLVLGAAGGVGLAAIELGKAFGARVVAAVSSPEKAAVAQEAGADEVIIYERAPFDKGASKALADRFKEAAGKGGFDLVYDPVGGDYAEPALRSLGWLGRYLVIGFAAGIPKLPLNLTLLQSRDIRGVFWGAFAAKDPQSNRANIGELLQLWADGKIGPRVTEVFPLRRGGDAIAKMAARGAIGKLVVEIEG